MLGAPPDPYLGLYAAIGGDHGSNSAVLEDISQQLEQVVGQLLTWADALQRACAGPHAAQLTAAPNSSQGVVGVVPASNGSEALAAPAPAPAPAAAAACGDAERHRMQAYTAGTKLTEAGGPTGLCEPSPEAAAAAAAAGAAAAPAAVAGICTASVATEHTSGGAAAAAPAAAVPPVDAQGCAPPPPPHQHGQGAPVDKQAAHAGPPAPAVPPEGPHDQVQRIQLWALVLVQALHDCTNSLDAAMGLFGGLTAGSRTFPTSHDLFLRGLVQQRRAAEMASQASKLQTAAHQLQQLLCPQGPLPAGGGGSGVWVQMSAALGQGAAQVAAANGQLLQALCWWLGWEGAPEECPLAQATFDTETWFHTLHQRHAQQGRRVAPFAVQLAAQDKAPLQALVNQLAFLLKEARKQVPTAAGVDLAAGRRQLFAQKEVGQLLQLQSVPLLALPPEDNPASAAAAAATAPLVQGLSVVPPGADPQQQQEQNQEQQQEQLQATSQLWELVLGEAYQELATSVEALVSLQLDHLGSSDLLQPDHRSMYLVWLQHLGAVEVTLRRVRRLAAAVQQQQQRQQEEQQGWQQQQQQLGQQGWQQHQGQQQPLAGTGAQLLTVTQKLLESLQLRLLWPHPAAQHPAVAAARGGDAVDSFFRGRAAQQAQQAPGAAAAAAAAAGDLRFSLTRGLQLLKGSKLAWHNRCSLLVDSLGSQAAQVDCTAAKKVLYGAALQELEEWPLHCRPVPMLQQTTGLDLGQVYAVQAAGAAGGTAAGGAYEAGSSGSSSFDKAGQRNRLSGVADAPPAAAKVGPEVQQPSARRNPASRSESGAAMAAGSEVATPATAHMPQGAANSAAAGPAAAADGVGQTVATAPGPGSTSAAGKPGKPSKPVPSAAAVAAAAAAAAAGVGRKRPTPPSSGAPAKRHSGVSQPPQSASGNGDSTDTSSAHEKSGRNAMPAAAAAPQQNRGLWSVGNGVEDAVRAGKRPSSSSSSPVAAKRQASSVLTGEGAAPAAAQAQGVAGSNVPGQACVSNPIMQQLMQATRGAGRQAPTAKRSSKAALIKSSEIAAAAAAAAYGAHAGLSNAGNSKASSTQSPAPAAAPGAAAAAAATERRGSGGPASSSEGGPPTSGGEDGTGVTPAANADVIILGPPESPTVPSAAPAAVAGAGRPAAAGGAGDQAEAASVTANACPAAAPSQPSSEDCEGPGQLLPALLERKLPKAVAEAEMERCAAVAREQALKDREAQRRRREAEALKQARAQARLQELHAEGQKRAAAEAAREVIRTEVRHQLDDLLGRAVRMLDLRAVLRALGLLTGRARSKAALLQAYKAARVQFHPDKWTRAEVRQQVYAEEVSKILNSRDLHDTL